ncbi:glycerophosphodiester phosphodiesterase family protein [Methylobacterium nodulans]|uniref:glycerophosphodiester phosphodiesterase n=1 Tax=Methylobacterium nodulans (strain LMG 21967 / CNCM I-2342 / ORS 2060) TaxID=460265 RepID=B8ICD8_METNO|nr:glycerophosphodiester phosphodiesterase family protein [Methylobacterium nodulans]ACL55526.1 glycerophosphoryl diester phosphodiesterase [Methylobacterium nodulans ORS 2060]
MSTTTPANAVEASTDWMLGIVKAAPNQTLRVAPGGTGTASAYTLVYDVYVPAANAGGWLPFLQTDSANSNDGDLFGKIEAGSYGIGIGGDYKGSAKLDAWNRIAFTVETQNGEVAIGKYINGELVGSQTSTSTDRYAIDRSKGFLIFSDEDGETSAGYLGSFLFADRALSTDEVKALGGASKEGVSKAAIAGASQFDFTDGTLNATFGTATLQATGLTPTFGTPATLGIPAMPDASEVLTPGRANDFLVIAHRGAQAYRPEHTLEAYKLAIDMGADFIEPDLVSTKDGVLVARHDPWLASVKLDAAGTIARDANGKPIVTSQTTNVADIAKFADKLTVKDYAGGKVAGWFVSDFTLAEIKELRAREDQPQLRPGSASYDNQFQIPTLAEIIALVKQTEADTGLTIGIYPETKDPTFHKIQGLDTSKMLIDALKEAGFIDPSRVFIQSFEFANLIELKTKIMPAAGVNLPLVQLVYFQAPYVPDDVAYNFSGAPGADPSVYNVLGLNLSATSTYEAFTTPQALKTIANLYASGLGPDMPFVIDAATGAPKQLLLDVHAAGLKVHPYTHRDDAFGANSKSFIDALTKAGVDGVFTDNTDTVVNAVLAAQPVQDAAGTFTGVPSLGGDPGVLHVPAPAKKTDGFVFDPAIDGTATTYTMIFDVLVKTGDFAGDWNALFQTNLTNGDDAKFFMKKDGATFGIGKGDYHGSATLDTWHRIAVTLTANGDGTSTMRKYIDGVEVGSSAYATADYTIDDKGVLLFADNDGEGVPSHLNSFYFTDRAMTGDEIKALGGSKVGGVLAAAPAQGRATQFDFANGTLAASFGSGTMAAAATVVPPEPAADKQAVVFGTPESLGLPALPGGQDGVISAPSFDPDHGLELKPGFAPKNGSATFDTYTIVYDLYLPKQTGLGSIFQSDLSSRSDGDLWLGFRDDQAVLGTDSQDEGRITLDAWHRLAFSIERISSDSFTLKKYVDGVKIGQQTVKNDFVIGDKGFLLFADDSNETPKFSLSSVAFMEKTLSESEVAALGGASAGGPFTAPIAGVNGVQFDFSKGEFSPSFGSGTLTARAPGVVEPPPPASVRVGAPIKDMLVTPTAANTVIDLAGVFAGNNLTYKVETAEGRVVNASVADGKLTLDFGGLGHSDVRVTATDAAGNTAADAFRVRVAGPNAYTIAVLPDTQDYTDQNTANGPPETFYRMTEWLAAHKDARKIQFVAHVGDVTQNNLPTEWVVAEKAMRTLDGKIPYSLLPGNHDQANGGTAANHSSVNLDTLFSPEKQAATNPNTFRGVYDQEPTSSRNNYHTFTAPDGTKWLILSMEFGPRDDVIRWASEVLDKHLDHRVMIISHSLTDFASRHDAAGLGLYDEGTGADYGLRNDPQSVNDGETVYRLLSAKYPNISFTFSGHIFGDGAETNVSYSQHGNPVYEMLVNYQNGISREITGNGNEALGNRGGNGAIRLVTIDPDNRTLSTETYFTEFDDYLDGYRVKPELDRNGLTGSYRGHQEEFGNVELGAPELRAVAKAGDDLYLSAPAGADRLAVTLNASRTLDPAHDIASYVWRNADGDVIARGAKPTVDLAVGRHPLTLEVTDAKGHVTTDQKLVVVKGDATLLVENFNDGNAYGWVKPPVPVKTLSTGTPAEFGLPALPGGEKKVAFVPALPSNEGLRVTPNLGAPAGTRIASYSVIFDILVPPGQGDWTSLMQTDVANKSDGDLFIRSNGNGTGGIGISSNYTGSLQYGAWQRVAFTFKEEADGTVTLNKFIEGVKVGSQSVSGDRFKLDVSQGALFFSDEDGEVSKLYVSSLLITDKVYTEAEIAALGGAKAGGIVASAPTPLSVQFDFNDAGLRPSFGPAEMSFGSLDNTGSSGNFVVKGSVFARPTAAEGQAAPEARLYDQSDAKGNLLLWGDATAKSWSDYAFEATLQSTDNDAIGLVFSYQDAQNHYRLTFNGKTNRRELVKVKDGVETVLASAAKGQPFQTDMAVKVAVLDGKISAFLNGSSIFDGVVKDATDPLKGGTVGLYSSEQRSSMFDDLVVTKVKALAHAGADQRAIDFDGDGLASVRLDAGASLGLADIVSYRWTDANGDEVATGIEPEVKLGLGSNALTLTVTDANGATATDRVDIDVMAKSQVLLNESFGSAEALAKWRILDEGESGGVGPDGKSSQWELRDGRLVQLSDLQSRQLEWQGGATAPNLWTRGWSPLGDGVNVLRRGTQAIYDDPAAKEWTDYSVEATIKTLDNDALGFLIHYVDAKNYYKVELDAEGNYDRKAGNGAGSLFQITRVRDGVEEVLYQVPAKYEPGTEMRLRVDVIGGKISAFLDGEAIFAYPIEDHAHPKGTVALYSWGSEGVSFDDVRVIAPGEAAPGNLQLSGGEGDDSLTGSAGNDTIRGGAGNDTLKGFAGADQLFGQNGNDTVWGGAGNDFVSGGFGADSVSGDAGDDLVFSDDDDDVADGGAGNDRVYGGTGADLVFGAAGDDQVYGEWGNDFVSGGEGHDFVSGGFGNDEVNGDAGNDLLFGDDGDDAVSGGEGDDRVYGGTGNDLVSGEAGADQVFGEQGEDVLLGGAGSDYLSGGAGADQLFGGEGADLLFGNAGADALTGGLGSDAFAFGRGDGQDVIRDFVTGGAERDVIAFNNGAFGSFAAVQAALRQEGSDAVIAYGTGDTITLQNVQATSLTAQNFTFA